MKKTLHYCYVCLLLMLPLLSKAQIPNTGLVYYFPFDTSADATIGSSSFNNDSLTNGKIGNAKWLADTLTAAIMPNLPYGNNERTIAFWLRHTGDVMAQPVIFRYGTLFTAQTFGLYFNTDSTISFQGFSTGNDEVLDSAYIGANKWYHIAISMQSDTLKVYLNGILNKTFTKFLNTYNSGNSKFYIGGLDGTMDELLIYNRAISDNEVLDIYNEGLCTFTVAYNIIRTGDEECPEVGFTFTNATLPIHLNITWPGNDIGVSHTVTNLPFSLTNNCPESYLLTAIDDKGCTATLNFVVDPVSIDKIINNALFSLYPNPSSTFVMIDGLTGPAIISIIDLFGSKVLQTNTTEPYHQLSLVQLPNGIYNIQIQMEQVVANKKLVICR